MRQAVIDMGTNTHVLMIVEREANESWTPVIRHRVFVMLGEDGLHTIGDRAMGRCLEAMKLFRAQIDAAGVEPHQVRAFGTAGLRMASNSFALCKKIQDETGIRVEIITGDQEAEAIYRGVLAAVPFPEGNVLIMDIGGGSVEFIIANRNVILWQQSFDIGISILHRNFSTTDPFSGEEERSLRDFLDLSLSAGTFDTIDTFLLDPLKKPKLYGHIKREQFEPLYEKFRHSTLAERTTWKELSIERMEMIVVSHVLVHHVLNLAAIKEIYTSQYSLKEGMLTVM
jgi:exopolyphosphatase / guanosine-5'-triphosphate,3'-diphosphate pyrophosphatase